MSNSKKSPTKERTASSKQQMQSLVKDYVCDPNKPGPWKAIVESSGPNYLEARSYDNIHRAMELLNDPTRAPTMGEYQEYEKLVTEACQLLTLARYHRQSKLAQKSNEYVVIVTAFGLKKGESEAVITERRRVMVEKQYNDAEETHRKLHGLKALTNESTDDKN